MQKTVVWLVVAAAGLGAMAVSYYGFQRITDPTPWTKSVLFVGRGELGGDPGAKFLKARLRVLPSAEQAPPAWLTAGDEKMARTLKLARQEKLIALPGLSELFTPEMLASGRLPAVGRDEVVAGAHAKHGYSLWVAGRTLQVVGVFRKEVVMFIDCYLLPEGPNAGEVFKPDDENVYDAYVLRPRTEREEPASTQPAPTSIKRGIAKIFPPERFSLLGSKLRSEPGPFALYLAGYAMLLLAGSVLFLRLVPFLARRARRRVFRRPLLTLWRWKTLLAWLHVTVFGVLVVGYLLAYLSPTAHAYTLYSTQEEFVSGEGPLGTAGEVLAARNVPLLMLVIFGVNLGFGTILTITLPSWIIPGLGALNAVIRPLWAGLALSPTSVDLARMQLPHSVTILIEMEAYVIAVFFALMVPIFLFRRREGRTVLRRYGRSVLLNLQGLLIVVIILAAAAVYEAIELILLM